MLSNIKLLVLVIFFTSGQSYTPIVYWHGLTANCCTLTSNKVANFLRSYLPGVHLVTLKFGNTIDDDTINSVLMHPDRQIEMACKMIQQDPLLANGFNAIGHSQGAQFLRGLIQRCPDAKVKVLISLAGQHQGVYGFPGCNPHASKWCDDFRKVLNGLAYLDVFQPIIVPATYWHNPLDEEAYIQESTFMADINNEGRINQTYIENLQKLEKFVMVKHSNDKVVIPQESSWFGFYKPGQDWEIESLFESRIYHEDRLGLKQMAADGKLYFLENDWEHVGFHPAWFAKHIAEVFLK